MKKTLSVLAILICIALGIFVTSSFWRTYSIAKIFTIIGQRESSLGYLNQASLIEHDFVFSSLHYKAPYSFLKELTLQDLQDNVAYTDTLLKLINKDDSKLKEVLPHAVDLIQKYGLSQLNNGKSRKDFLKFVKKVKDSSPNSSLSYYLKGKYYFKKKKFDKAQVEFEVAAQKLPFYQSMLRNLFYIYSKNKQYQKIIALNVTVKRSDTITPKLAFYIGESYYHLRQYKLASKYLEIAKKQKKNLKALALLGNIGIRKNIDRLANLLIEVYKKQPKDVQPLLNWMEYKFKKQHYTEILAFYDTHSIQEQTYKKQILKTIAATGNYKRFEDFVGENSIDVNDFPILLFYKAKTDFKNSQWKPAITKYLKFLQLPVSSKYKKQIYSDLLKCFTEIRDYKSVLEISQKLLSINPETIDIYIVRASAFFALKQSYQALKVLKLAAEFFPENTEHIHYGIKILKSEGSNFRLVNFLKNMPIVTTNIKLGIELARAAILTKQNNVAFSTIKKLRVSTKLRNSIPSDLNQFYTEYKDTNLIDIVKADPKHEYTALMSQNQKYKNINKHQLPPSPDISYAIDVVGSFKTNYQYRGFVLEEIPEGKKVELIEYVDIENSPERWLSIRYNKNRFRIKEKYLNIEYPPHREVMGKAYIANIDKDYHAYGVLSRLFKKGESLIVKSHHNSDLKKKIKFNEESWVKFGKIPTKTYTAEVKATTYRHVHPDLVNITNKDFAFVKEHAFQVVVNIEAENKIALFGPNHAGISVFQRDKSNYPVLLHKSVIEDNYIKRRADQDFSDLLFKGYLILDVNGDNILDYLSIWQSNAVKEKGIIHILSSNSIVSYSEFYLETELSFIKNYQYVSTINPLLFLKNIDDDRFIEILSYKDIGRRGDPDNSVGWFDIHNINTNTLSKTSHRYPGFYEEQLYKLLDVYKTKKAKNGSLSNQYEDSYQDVLSQIDAILERVKLK